MLEGRCLCGGLRWSLEGTPRRLVHCYCTTCRKAHGSAFVTWLEAPGGRLRWRSGTQPEALERVPEPYGERAFCATCGSPAPLDGAAVPAGNLVADPGLRPSHRRAGEQAPGWLTVEELPSLEAVSQHDVSVGERPGRGPGGGSCLCGQVRWRSEDTPIGMVNCHCMRCRRARGAAHATNLFVPRAGFQWDSGESEVSFYKLPEAERFGQAFCRCCGSPVPRVAPGADRVNVPAGPLDGDPGTGPQLHIHVASAAPWHRITDTLAQYAAGLG